MAEQREFDPLRAADQFPAPGYFVRPEIAAETGLIEAVQARLIHSGFVRERVPLAALHRHVPAEAAQLNEHYTNAVSRAFYAPCDGVTGAYHALLARIARDVFPRDFLFQAQPIVRFHFPVPFPEGLRGADGQPRQIHSDLLGGHPAEMIQGWVALTDCEGSAALQCAPRGESIALLREYKDALGAGDPPFCDSLRHFYRYADRVPEFGRAVEGVCRPVSMRAGDALFFDPRCLHGGAENTTGRTRVSLDFRLLPVEAEGATLAAAATPAARRFCRGEVFHAASARTMFGA
ncbi:MAG: phytanoyl-CoA dioxygenase family protein [Candidatus Hydrogenedentes bacterium]|nr:phytanoyl-CoA dioxygenase family protein [Candidatus Hydrogenedentota bacterium]